MAVLTEMRYEISSRLSSLLSQPNLSYFNQRIFKISRSNSTFRSCLSNLNSLIKSTSRSKSRNPSGILIESSHRVRVNSQPSISPLTSTRNFHSTSTYKMASPEIPVKVASSPIPSNSIPSFKTSGLPILTQLPTLPELDGIDLDRNPLDHFRLAVADQASKALDLPLQTVFAAVQHPAKDADYSLAVPRFRLPGKPNEHAEKVAKAVSGL